MCFHEKPMSVKRTANHGNCQENRNSHLNFIFILRIFRLKLTMNATIAIERKTDRRMTFSRNVGKTMKDSLSINNRRRAIVFDWIPIDWAILRFRIVAEISCTNWRCKVVTRPLGTSVPFELMNEEMVTWVTVHEEERIILNAITSRRALNKSDYFLKAQIGLLGKSRKGSRNEKCSEYCSQ